MNEESPFMRDVNEIINGIISAEDGECIHCERMRRWMEDLNIPPNNAYDGRCFNHQMKQLFRTLAIERNQRRNTTI